MSNKTRKRFLPVALVMAVAAIGVMALAIAFASAPQELQAHGDSAGDCSTELGRAIHDALSPSDPCPIPNTAPMAGAAIADMSISAGGMAMAQSSITDADADDMLTWTVMSSDEMVATAIVDDMGMVTVTGVGAGTATITVTATDEAGEAAMQSFMVTVRVPAMAMVTLDGKTGGRTSSGGSDIQLTIPSLPDVDGSGGMSVGSSVIIYLEDDFQEPDSIPMSSVYLVASGGDTSTTGNGARVYVTSPVKLSTSDYFDKDKKDIAIRVLVPDMCTNATDACEGPNGLQMGQKVSVVIESDSGIKNPSEAGSHSTGYALLPPTETEIPGRTDSRRIKVNDVATVAKITLSDVDNSRGYEMTVTGSGFNNGTTAGVYVLAGKAAVWDTLDCAAMNAAAGSSDAEGMGFCRMYASLSDMEKAVVQGLDYTSGPAEAAACEGIIRSGTEVGGAIVGSDDKVAVTFEVTAPTFQPGNVNYICMVDGEGRMSSTDVEDFNLESSIKVVPGSVATGDTVNVFAQDFPATAGAFEMLKIAGGEVTIMRNSSFYQSSRAIGSDGSGEVTFEVPGGLDGVLRIDAQWGTGDNKVSEDSKITITGADLEVSKSEVRPNETITINGNGFGSQTCIPFSNITLDNVPVMVHPDSEGCKVGSAPGVGVSNSGQFVATVILWPMNDSGTNPTLIPGTHELSVEDTSNYTSSANLTIEEPSISVTPDVAGPRDYITVTGENWPVENLDNTLNLPVVVLIDDFGTGGRSYPVYADAVGRFSVEHRVHRRVAIPSDVQVKATYQDVAKIGSFSVPASTIDVTPGEGQPGDMVTLSSGNMPVYTEVDYIEIGGTTYDDPGVNTDRDGNVTVESVLIPGLDPGVYSVVMNVDGTIAIGEVNVLAESSAAGAPSELPGAVENLGDSLVAIFHFDDVGKTWSFHDPRPEFADLNTLTEMVNGEAYWILVSESVEDVVLNNKVRSLTCRGDDCWNLEVW